MKPDLSRIPVIDIIKVLASQLIIWHHLAFYGPMSDVVYPHATEVIAWLYDHARIAVQAFLVIGGFLAARSLVPRVAPGQMTEVPLSLPRLVWRRYVRLIRPYLVAMIAAIVAAALARALIEHPATPEAPSAGQLLAHVFLLQDVLDVDALSAGVWYVAIDFQLYVLLLMLLWSARRLAAVTGLSESMLVVPACVGLTGASLFWLNREPALDAWAIYFFGAYGLGILAQWISARSCNGCWAFCLGLLVIAALVVDWRSRLLVAGVTALLLIWSARGLRLPRWLGRSAWAGLGRISYSVFLIHYPVCLLVGAIVYSLWPHSVALNSIGMVAAWLFSLGAGALLYRIAEQSGPDRNQLFRLE